MFENFMNNIISCKGNSNVQISSGGKSVTVQNDVRVETDNDVIKVSFKKPRKVYINGNLYYDPNGWCETVEQRIDVIQPEIEKLKERD